MSSYNNWLKDREGNEHNADQWPIEVFMGMNRYGVFEKDGMSMWLLVLQMQKRILTWYSLVALWNIKKLEKKI